MFRMRMAAGLVVALLAVGAVRAEVPDVKQTEPPAKKPTLGIAHIELTGAYPDGPQAPGLFGEIVEGLSTILARLDKAARDDSVSEVVLHINNPQLGWGKLNDLRQAVGKVRAKGKKVHAYLEEGGSGEYLIATACDDIAMPESGVLLVLGLRAEVSFYKNLLDTIHVKPDMLRVGEYKSAAEPYTNTEMSKAFREEMDQVLDDYYALLIDTIAEGRKLDKEKVKAAIDNGPYTAIDAKRLGLIDRTAYADELEKDLSAAHPGSDVKFTRKYGKKKLDTDFSGFAGMVKLMNLLMGVETTAKSGRGPKVAVIHANGPIMTGKSTSSLFGDEVMGSETIVKAIETAGKDSTVKAVVLRVDSPGGSALASDLIWRALEQIDKPVVVSMANVAASGGYYISMGADVIFAEPGTITGSIGVLGGKLAFKEMWEKIGVNTTVLSRGKNSGALSVHEPFSDSERAAMQKLLNDIYDQFTKKAAQGRKMEHEKLEKLARGRIYTGATALRLGLVDKLGTLEDAIAHAAELGGLKDDKYDRLVLPKATSPFEQLLGPLDDTSARSRHAAELRSALEALAPDAAEHLGQLDVMTRLSREPRLLVMPFRLKVR